MSLLWTPIQEGITYSLAWFMTSIILDAKHENVWNNQTIYMWNFQATVGRNFCM